jgi:heavy metal sensor kinase
VLIDRSDPQVDATFPGTPQVRAHGGNREVAVQGDDGRLVLVGQSLEQLRSDRWQTVLGFAGAGVAALALALVGGWLLVGRALRPIGRIAETAEAMSESNLSLRVDITRTEDELGSVAAALNRAFDRLQEAFERQTRFTADASHELRTPLASLMAELEWALAKPRSEAEYQNTLQVCARAAQRMRNVVDGLLTLARADAGASPLRREPVNLTTLARETAAAATSMATARGISIRLDGAPAIVEGDPDRLRELISNLVLNAVQYSSPGGTVSCSVSTVGAVTRLEVADSGPGIDPQDLAHIFERFSRANKARSGPAGGAGLGLAISKWITESHGGQIRCESSKGRGSRFTVDLPMPAMTNGSNRQP